MNTTTAIGFVLMLLELVRNNRSMLRVGNLFYFERDVGVFSPSSTVTLALMYGVSRLQVR
jgi:hypothetical protein